jgi:hypothetical protein
MLPRSLPAGFIAPCLPSKTAQLPSGRHWLHEIKHDGFRVIARKKGLHVRLYGHPGNSARQMSASERPDCVADDAVNCEPVSTSNSLVTGKLTGNFAASDPPLRF